MPLSEEELVQKEADLVAKEGEMKKTLEGISGKVKSQEDLVKLLSDPAVREVLAAREVGLDVTVASKKPGETPELETEPPDLAQLDNRGLVEYMAKSVFPSALKIALKPVMESLAGVRGYVDSQEDATVLKQVDEARKKFPDFNDYKPDILEISRANSGLSVEELYYIARRRKGGNLQVNPSSEKPSSPGGKPAQIKKVPMKPGRAGFEEKLAAALEGLTIEE